MSREGCGRGRGWLRLEKKSENIKPGVEVQKSNPRHIHVQQEKNNYGELIQQFDFLDQADDGILLNQKLKHIREVFMNSCNTEEEITAAVNAIYQKCLKEENFIEKFVIFITSAFFLNKQKSEDQTLWKFTIRHTFFNQLQVNYENKDVSRKKTPAIFYNTLRLHSKFFHYCRKINRNGYPSVEKVSIVGYLNLLLDYGESLDIKMFVSLICENQSILIKLYTEENQEIMEILNKIKVKIVCDGKLSHSQKFLLLFAFELLRNHYNILPEELLFYKNNFEEDDINNILIKYGYVQIEIEKIKLHNLSTEENSKLKENSTTLPTFMEKSLNLSENGESINNSQSLHNNNFSEEVKISNSFNSNNLATQYNSYKMNKAVLAKHDTWKGNVEDKSFEGKESFKTNDLENISEKNWEYDGKQHQEEKIGRPILGVGVRLKQRDSLEKWN